MMEGNDCVGGVLGFKPFLPTGEKRAGGLVVASLPPQPFHVPGQNPVCDPGGQPQQDGVNTC